jgi:hypothetical protein
LEFQGLRSKQGASGKYMEKNIFRWKNIFLRCNNNLSNHRKIMPMNAPRAPEIITYIEMLEKRLAVLGVAFAVTEALSLAVAVHCSPQANPLGQQLPPTLAAQLYQFCGHCVLRISKCHEKGKEYLRFRVALAL